MTAPEEPTDGTNDHAVPPELDGPPSLIHAPLRFLQARPPWVTVAAAGGGVVITGTLAVIGTLALTHATAVRENAVAYVNGRELGYAHGFLDSLAMMLGSDTQDFDMD